MKKQKNQDTSQVWFIEAGPDQEGQRIDNFLLGQLKGVPKSHIYRILRRGEVRVNKGRVKAHYRLHAGDRIRVPPVRVAEREPASVGERALARLQASVIYEDKALLVLNKPAGMAVHGGSGVSYGVIEALRALRPEAAGWELAHRLDRDTSGCLVVAKRRSALRALHEALRGRDVDKRYLALLQGRWQGGDRVVDAPLVKNVLRSGERVVRVAAEGKPSRSEFRPLARFADCTLMEIVIHTGRTHQIRVHAAHVGHPVAGDEKYGDSAFNRLMRERGLKRLFLHAAALTFELPERERPVAVSAPLDPDLSQLLERLKDGNE